MVVKSKAFVAMTLLSIAIVVTILIVNAQSKETNTPKTGIKELITNVVKEQSQKINDLLNKIQANAQRVLQELRSLNQISVLNKKPKNSKLTLQGRDFGPKFQIEPTDTGLKDTTEKSRSFTSHFTTTGYGISGTAYGGATYHHHSIGFDPLNIVLSMSLLSFLFQALQTLLANTRLPTPVIEAKSLDPVEKFVKKLREKKGKKYWNKYKSKY
ncbi:unnamed protein product [Pieris macdunnoughi]|uniref:Uncharacterized protein n=1 Tax=Pieris macdunnoughi TaxID=345717 RepID=A0A821S2E8_9NEOP|nr:unnamed protein product [Pieris macdunnoughi]